MAEGYIFWAKRRCLSPDSSAWPGQAQQRWARRCLGSSGVVEAALTHTGSALGIAATSLLALALIRRLRSLLWMLIGLLLAARIVHRNSERPVDVSAPLA